MSYVQTSKHFLFSAFISYMNNPISVAGYVQYIMVIIMAYCQTVRPQELSQFYLYCPYHKFVECFALCTAPAAKLIGKNYAKWVKQWGEEQMELSSRVERHTVH